MAVIAAGLALCCSGHRPPSWEPATHHPGWPPPPAQARIEFVQTFHEPKDLDDLRDHDCIVYGASVAGTVWRLRGPDGDVSIPVDARVASDSMHFTLRAALTGLGVALLPVAIALREFETGGYRREFRLTNLIDQSRIDASLRDGVLRLTLPKAEAARPKRIEVRTG